MFKELIYNWNMDRKYEITELNEMYNGLPTKYQFGPNTIDTKHILIDAPVYRDPWDNMVQLGDVYITINGQEKDVLKYYPVKLGEDGLNQYTQYVSYWLIFDKKKKEKRKKKNLLPLSFKKLEKSWKVWMITYLKKSKNIVLLQLIKLGK